ncbi:OLC1v1030000C1 [Oldenlandia corymbosa var. corymbosa]|uniref:OLC1v1030000C1 n=1 Tax=Oldenlandia corymbosa var. corymbosa TaxID=529605 RepID=A0AAV1CI10_OLDCO|nr:OLC1v1030000C1 [Oldenlandia corymbosa var. corymbosa]
MGSSNITANHELHFVFMNYDPEYERLRSNKTKKGAKELHLYLSKKHDELLANTFEAGSYQKTLSLVIVDGFAAEITDDQANVLRSAKQVRLVEKNQELS